MAVLLMRTCQGLLGLKLSISILLKVFVKILQIKPAETQLHAAPVTDPKSFPTSRHSLRLLHLTVIQYCGNLTELEISLVQY